MTFLHLIIKEILLTVCHEIDHMECNESDSVILS